MSQPLAFGSTETKFFFELTPEKILDAVETLGVRCTGRCLQLNSMENRVFEVELDIDPEIAASNRSEAFRIVKFYRPGRWTREQILEEHEFLFDLIEYEIPVVAPVRNAAGESLFRVPNIDISFAVFPKVGGRSPDELDDSQLLQVGRLLARLHNVGGTKQAQHRLKLTPDTIARTAMEFLHDGEFLPADMEDSYCSLVEDICEHTTPWFETTSYQRIHGDCHFGNLLWGPLGPFWVDFDDMMVGPPVQDMWLLIPGRAERDSEKFQLLLSGYEQMREFDRGSIRLIEPLRAIRMIHFSAWIAKRWEDPAFQRTFVEFGTARYWRDQLVALQEQWELIRRG